MVICLDITEEKIKEKRSGLKVPDLKYGRPDWPIFKNRNIIVLARCAYIWSDIPMLNGHRISSDQWKICAIELDRHDLWVLGTRSHLLWLVVESDQRRLDSGQILADIPISTQRWLKKEYDVEGLFPSRIRDSGEELSSIIRWPVRAARKSRWVVKVFYSNDLSSLSLKQLEDWSLRIYWYSWDHRLLRPPWGASIIGSILEPDPKHRISRIQIRAVVMVVSVD